MPPRKSASQPSGGDDSGAEAYYVSSRDIPLDILRVRATELASNPAERRAARRELLLKMGAKPPKGPAINYRVLMEAKKVEKEAAIADYRNVSLLNVALL